MSKITAKEFFELQTKFMFAESELDEKLLDIFGIPDEDGRWIMDDFSYDYYDHSFELLNVDNGWEPTEEQLNKCWELGFDRCWLNYKDGTEKYYYGKKPQTP